MSEKEWLEGQVFLNQIEYWKSNPKKEINFDTYVGEDHFSSKYDTENDVLLCDKGDFPFQNIDIKDIMIEGRYFINNQIQDCTVRQYEQYLIIISNDFYPTVLAHWIARDDDYKEKAEGKYLGDEMIMRPCWLSYDLFIKRYSARYNTLIFSKITNMEQMNQILNILTKKYRDWNGHFYNVNEQLIYKKICETLLRFHPIKVKQKLSTYLAMRKRDYPNIYKLSDNHYFKIYCKEDGDKYILEPTYKLLEFSLKNYLPEDCDIIDLMEEIDRQSEYKYNYYIITKDKNGTIRKTLFARAKDGDDKNFKPNKKEILPFFCSFFNNYINPKQSHMFHVTTFSILPKTREQLKQLQRLINDLNSMATPRVLESLNEFCSEDFENLEPLTTVDYGNEVKQLDSNLNKNNHRKQELLEIEKIAKTTEQEKNNQLAQTEEEITCTLEQLNMLYQLKEQLTNKSVQTKRILVPLEQICIQVDDHLEINPIYANYLRYIDLSAMNVKNVKVSGLDFSNTNAHIEPQLVYQKDMSNGNYEGINFELKDFTGVNISNAQFTQEFFSYDFSNAISESAYYVNKQKIKQ